MTRKKSLTSMLLAVFTATLFITAAPMAHAWVRTIGYRGSNIFGNQRYEWVFPSDSGWTGAPSGNAATSIYVDFSTKVTSVTTNVVMQACAYAYNGSGGGCGAATNANYAPNAVYDVSIGKWMGTGSNYDYFYVTLINNTASSSIAPMGIAAIGP